MTTPTERTQTPLPGQWRLYEKRFLYWAITLSVLFHVALIAWQRTPVRQAPNTSQTLEVVLVNASTELAPVEARLLAQNNMDGGGDAPALNASHALPYTGDTAVTLEVQALTKKMLQLESEQLRLLTRLQSTERVAESQTAPYFMKESEAPGNDDAQRDSILQNAKIAILNRQLEQYNQRPRKHFDAPSAQAVRYAEYIDQWRQRIEQTGALHYPRSIGQTVYGSVQATLTIGQDGTLTDITIDQPSDQALLNQAVRRIAQLSAPFSPFPPDMARQIDQLVLTRTWHFVNGVLQAREK